MSFHILFKLFGTVSNFHESPLLTTTTFLYEWHEPPSSIINILFHKLLVCSNTNTKDISRILKSNMVQVKICLVQQAFAEEVTKGPRFKMGPAHFFLEWIQLYTYLDKKKVMYYTFKIVIFYRLCLYFH